MSSENKREGLSFVQYQADGIQTNFTFSFRYIDREYITVRVGETTITDFIFVNANEINIDPAPAVGLIVTIRRETESTEKLVDFEDGGIITEELLDMQFDQVIDLVQEAKDVANQAVFISLETMTGDAGFARLINVGDAVDPQDAMNKRTTDAMFNTYASEFDTELSEVVDLHNQVVVTKGQIDAIKLDYDAKYLEIVQIGEDAEDAKVSAETAQGLAEVAQGLAEAAVIDTKQDILDLQNDVVYKVGVQTVEDKVLTTASIQSPSRLDVKKDTLADLTTYAITASNGQIVFATDTKEYFAIKDGLLSDLGGGTELVAAGASGNVLTSDGTDWVSMPVVGVPTYNVTLSNGLIYPIWDFTTPVKLADPATLPAGTGLGTAWSPDGQFLTVAHSTTPFITIYQRSGTTFTKLTNPATLPIGNGVGTAWSPDGQFLTMTYSTTPFITIYRTSSDTPSANGSPVTTTVINREIR